MKGLKKIALASAIAAVSAGAQAELKALDDSAMGELTGQAGLTIDLETKYTIGEFMYKDAGSVFFKGMSLSGNTNAFETGLRTASGLLPDNGLVDNIRIKLDIAGGGALDNGQADNQLDYQFSRVRTLADVQASANGTDVAKFQDGANGEISLSDAQSVVDAFGANALVSDNALGSKEVDAGTGAVTYNTDMTIGDKKTFGDGDLLIHVSFKDAWRKTATSSYTGITGLLSQNALGAVSFSDLVNSGAKSVDFNFSIDAIGLAASAVEAGDTIGAADVISSADASFDGTDADASTTVLLSNLSVNGYLGPVDIHIENKGNGFAQVIGFDPATGPIIAQGVGNANSKINWNTYINITDLDIYLDIAGVQISDLKINNTRGDVSDLEGNFAFGFAQSKQQIYAVRNAAGLDQTALKAGLLAGDTYTDAKDVLDTLGNDGVAINTVFKGDMEIGALSFGDTGTSIGELYWTDIESTTNWTISAH
jgi:hypothetical protein